MPNKTVEFLLKEVADIRKELKDHLIQSGGIQTHLKWNTAITGGIFIAIMGRLIFEMLFHK
jgi:hypothetical protein